MAVDTADMVAFMQVAYRQGVLDRVFPMLGDSMSAVMRKTGMTFEDFVYRIDEASVETLDKVGDFFVKWGGALRVLSSDRLMGLARRMLDFTLVARATRFGMQAVLMVVISKGSGVEHPVRDLLQGYLSAARDRLPFKSGSRKGD